MGQRVRLASLLEEVKEQLENLLKEENELPEELYVAFENRFRGTREEIKERLKVYLPYVHQVQMDDDHFRILDLGCGRGEWLELIKESGYMGRGVDINRVMVRQCQELGLDVVESDMIDYLKKQESNSFSMVTGFHILEHLPIGRIISLLDEVLRVLRRGGMAVFEVPNPENLLVATHHFYLDPTHKHKLPLDLVFFLLESRGFKKIEILRHHPHEFIPEAEEASAAVKSLLSLFNRERDYSVIAYKE
jgi:O-antigen chain-terminating methyltransferase